MTQTRNNGIVTVVPSDPYNPPADLAAMADSADVVRRCANQAAVNALTGLRVGSVMCRTDLGGQPLFTWNGTVWIAATAKVDIGQGEQRPILKGTEALVNTNEFSVGFLVFAEPFPNICTAVTMTHSTGSLTGVTFRVITRNANSVEFVAYKSDGTGLGAAGLYINYIAVGY